MGQSINPLRQQLSVWFHQRVALLHLARFSYYLLMLMLLGLGYRIALYYTLKFQDIPPSSFEPEMPLLDFLSLCRADFLIALLISLFLLPLFYWFGKSSHSHIQRALQHGSLLFFTLVTAVYFIILSRFGIGLTINILTSSFNLLTLKGILTFIPWYGLLALLLPNLIFCCINRIRSSLFTWSLIGLCWILVLLPTSLIFAKQPLADTLSPPIAMPPGTYTLWQWWHFNLPDDPTTATKLSGLHLDGSLFEQTSTASTPPLLTPVFGSKTPRHIIFFVIESLRADSWKKLTNNNSKIPMPFLAKLTEESVVLEHHYSTSNNTFPSMFSILTGLYPPAENMDFILKKQISIPILPSFLQHNSNTQVQALVLDPGRTNFYFPTYLILNSGFELINRQQIPTYGREDKNKLARNEFSAFDYFLEKLKAQDPTSLQTVNIYKSFIPHFYYDDYGPEYHVISEPNKFYDKYVNNLFIDDLLIHRLCDAINADPARRDSTILIITGDHGEAFGEKGFIGHGNNPFEASIHIPCIIYAPGILSPAKVNLPTSHADLIPTLLDLMHTPYDQEQFQGDSLLRPISRKYIFYAGYEGSLAAISTNQIKTIWQTSGQRLVFNLSDDPNETSPLKPDLYNEQFNALFAFARQQEKRLNHYQTELLKKKLTAIGQQ